LEQSGGALAGKGTLSVSGTFKWSGGQQTEVGKTEIAKAGTLSIDTSTANVFLMNGRTLQVDHEATATWTGSNAWELGDSASIENAGTFNANGGETFGLSLNGGANQLLHNAAGGTFRKNEGTGTLNIEVPLKNDGTVEIATGILDAATYTQTAGAALHVHVAGTVAGTGFTQLRVDHEATFAGTLQVTTPSSFKPKAGQSFQIIETPVRSGTFAKLEETGAGIGGGLSYALEVETESGKEGAKLLVAKAVAPAVKTEPASSITPTTATLNATVNPDGANVTDCKFEYGATTSYGATAPCSSLPGSGSSAVPVSAGLTGLSPGTTYHSRISATNAGGTKVGADAEFTTPAKAPSVVTAAPSSITQTTATLNATVNPNGSNVNDCKFEYGTSASYGATAPCSSSPGSGSSAVAVSAGLTGLSPGTTYHSRISATNAGGTDVGSDQQFTTLSPPPATTAESGVLASASSAPPAPVLGRSANVTAAAGQVSVRLPGTSTFVPLSSVTQIPIGTVIDASGGTVSITTAAPGGGTQTGQFSGGQFVLQQGKNGLVIAVLTGGDLSVCARASKASSQASAGISRRRASGKHVIRKLWANVHGKFGTRARYVATAVQGTEWLTEDLCEGSLVRVRRGRVKVTDIVRHRHLVLRAGRSYTAKAPTARR